MREFVVGERKEIFSAKFLMRERKRVVEHLCCYKLNFPQLFLVSLIAPCDVPSSDDKVENKSSESMFSSPVKILSLFLQR